MGLLAPLSFSLIVVSMLVFVLAEEPSTIRKRILRKIFIITSGLFGISLGILNAVITINNY